MTKNGGSGEKSSEEKKVPTVQEAERESVSPTAAPSAALPRAKPRQEEHRPRHPSPSHVRVQLGGPRISTPPPPRPPRTTSQGGGGGIVPTGGGILVGSGASGASSGEGISPDSQSGVKPLKRKSDVIAPVGIRPICSVCHRDFYSWKALFGHMRSHPERAWRGCFPPPVEGTSQPPTGATNAGADQGGERSGGRGLDIDLNQPQEPGVEFGANERTPTEKKDLGSTNIDINKPPPSDDEDIA